MDQCDPRVLIIAVYVDDGLAAGGFPDWNTYCVPPDSLTLKLFRNLPKEIIEALIYLPWRPSSSSGPIRPHVRDCHIRLRRLNHGRFRKLPSCRHPSLDGFFQYQSVKQFRGTLALCTRLVALRHSCKVEPRMLAEIKCALVMAFVASCLFNLCSG
jgi:hypothetical protein